MGRFSKSKDVGEGVFDLIKNMGRNETRDIPDRIRNPVSEGQELENYNTWTSFKDYLTDMKYTMPEIYKKQYGNMPVDEAVKRALPKGDKQYRDPNALKDFGSKQRYVESLNPADKIPSFAGDTGISNITRNDLFDQIMQADTPQFLKKELVDKRGLGGGNRAPVNMFESTGNQQLGGPMSKEQIMALPELSVQEKIQLINQLGL